ncbi:MIR motif-containing protein [Syncephalis plumigaleata]|nr:MIR motif-containing protein [Syncephalis plumigaleata]
MMVLFLAYFLFLVPLFSSLLNHYLFLFQNTDMLRMPSLITRLAILAVTVLLQGGDAAEDFTVEPGFEAVTCGSTIRLVHQATQYQLHSLEAKYGQGQGSGQQIVTALKTDSDQDCFWLVKGSIGTNCLRGTPVQCGDTIRLMHYMTGKHLHSHTFSSPLSQQQEVSGFADEDDGDHWIVECPTDLTAANGKSAWVVDGTPVWTREIPVYLRHANTDTYLSASSDYIYGSPIRGQMEVSAASYSSDNTLWQAANGVYFGIPKNSSNSNSNDTASNNESSNNGEQIKDDHDEL